MLRLTSLFFLLLLVAGAPKTANATTLTTLGEGQHATTFFHQQQKVTLVASEREGLLRMDKTQRTSLLSGHFGQIDSRQTAEQETLLALLDVNTQDTRLVITDLTSATELTAIPAGNADTEAVCLGRIDDTLMLFRANAAGQLLQSAIRLSESGTTVTPLRTVNIGSGIKACSVDDTTQTLYLADEFAGVWAMPAHQESETERELIVYAPDNSIEGVSVSEDGLLAWVSPDVPTLYIRDVSQAENLEYSLPEHVVPETLHISRIDNGVVANILDDSSATIMQLHVIRSTSPRKTRSASLPALIPSSETTPVKRFGDAADDPAIWINHDHPDQSLILGTDKKAGLFVYDLAGNQQQFLPVGRVNNVDVRYNWQLENGDTIDIAAASNRSDNSISVFSIARESGRVAEIARVPTTLDDVYGLCMSQHDDRIDIFINGTSGEYQRYQLQNNNATLTAQLRDSFRLPSQPEGCVADDENGLLYMGEEAKGVWLAKLTDKHLQPALIIRAVMPVKPDIEGLALYTINGQRYLIASSQGNNRYAVYQTQAPFSLLGVFTIDADVSANIDGVSETDGLEATSHPLGSAFPNGLLVVQDGRNVMPTENQNFKLVDGSALKALIQRLSNISH